MALKIVTVGNKQYLIDKSFKYRESWTLNNGTTSWRCCSKNCSSTLKTNIGNIKIIERKGSHEHPSNYRSSTPTHTTPKINSSTPTTQHAPISGESVSSVTDTPTTNTSVQLQTPTGPSTPELVAENELLKNELAKLKKEADVLLQHSIESDQRLLELNQDIFTMTPTRVLSKAVPIPTSEQATETKPRPSLCAKCVILEEEAKKMIDSIRCLEAENETLKRFCETAAISKTQTRLSPDQITLHNSFDALNALNEEVFDDSFKVIKNKKYRKKTNTRNSKPTLPTKYLSRHSVKKQPSTINSRKTKVPFQKVTVVGDSHARHLASLISPQVSSSTSVSGFCKPGAGLLNIAPANTSAQHSSSHCYVLLAGTNDVSAGRQDIIFSHMETIIQNCSKTSRVLLTPLFHRYDLPSGSPIHRTTSLVNNYLAELCDRYEGTELLDVSKISRHYFTKHGLHLRAQGKQLLAELLVQKLAVMGSSAARTVPLTQRLPTITPPTSAPGQLKTLPYETYAVAVKASPSVTTPPAPQTPTTPPKTLLSVNEQTDVFLLGKPLLASTKI